MFLFQSTTILAYICLVQLDNVFSFNTSLIQQTSPNMVYVDEDIGIRYITTDLLRQYVKLTVSIMIDYNKRENVDSFYPWWILVTWIVNESHDAF